MDRHEYYVLKNRVAVPVSIMEWSEWHSSVRQHSAEWIVGKTQLHNAEVSTVFLGLDHGHNEERPMVFETLVFGGAMDGDMERYSTWKEAEAGHWKMVDLVGRQKG